MATAKIMYPSSAPHGKLHKRNTSADTSISFTTSPLMPNSPTSIGRPSLDISRRPTLEESWEEASTTNSNLKVRPFFRKLSTKDSGIVDLSRPAAENEGLAGLGIAINEYGNGPGYGFASKSASDVSFEHMNRPNRTRHIRSPSSNSQFSTTTANSFQRPNPSYARPTTRPFTPPISQSYTTSLGGRSSSDEDVINEKSRTEEDMNYRQLMSHAIEPKHYRSGSLSSAGNISAPAPLYIRTSDSVTRFNSPSQTSLHATRSRGATLQSVDTVSPSSRPSMDKTFGFFRQRSGGTEAELIDSATSRAASIQAARIAYQEKEDAKARKAEKEEIRQQERRYKKEEHKRKKSETEDFKRRKSETERPRRTRTRSSSNTEKAEEIGGKEYANLKRENSRTLPKSVDRISPARRDYASRERTQKKKNGGKRAWYEFLAWIRTRFFRFGRKMKGNGSRRG